MGAMPMVIVFAMIFSLLSYNFLQEGMLEKKKGIFFYSLQKEILDTHNKKQSAKHNGGSKGPRNSVPVENKEYKRENKPTPIFLTYLLENPTNDLLQFLQKVLLHAYAPIIEDKELFFLMVQDWVKKGEARKKCLDLWPKKKEFEPLFYQMLKGGFEYEPKQGMRMAPLEDLFHFSNTKGLFVYSKASLELLELYFGKAITAKIIEKEKAKKGCLSSVELQEILVKYMDSERAKKCLAQIVIVG